jgi:hypothetical protein
MFLACLGLMTPLFIRAISESRHCCAVISSVVRPQQTNKSRHRQHSIGIPYSIAQAKSPAHTRMDENLHPDGDDELWDDGEGEGEIFVPTRETSSAGVDDERMLLVLLSIVLCLQVSGDECVKFSSTNHNLETLLANSDLSCAVKFLTSLATIFRHLPTLSMKLLCFLSFDSLQIVCFFFQFSFISCL